MSSASASPNNEKSMLMHSNASFEDLPPEVRLEIYRYVFSGLSCSATHCHHHRQLAQDKPASLLYVSRRINIEYHAHFYANYIPHIIAQSKGQALQARLPQQPMSMITQARVYVPRLPSVYAGHCCRCSRRYAYENHHCHRKTTRSFLILFNKIVSILPNLHSMTIISTMNHTTWERTSRIPPKEHTRSFLRLVMLTRLGGDSDQPDDRAIILAEESEGSYGHCQHVMPSGFGSIKTAMTVNDFIAEINDEASAFMRTHDYSLKLLGMPRWEFLDNGGS